MPSSADLKKVQALSGLFMAIYVVMHLTNHYTLNISYDAADKLMMRFRNIYQNPLFEMTFFGAMAAHYYSNYQIYTRRSKLDTKKKKNDDANKTLKVSPELKAHRYAGYLLSIFVVVHVIAVRLTPLVYFDNAQDFDYTFAAAAIDFFPFHSFTVYYIVLGMAGGWHLIYGTRAALVTLQGKSATGTAFPIPLKMVAAASHLLIVGAVLALGKYYTNIGWSEKTVALHGHFFKSMGM